MTFEATFFGPGNRLRWDAIEAGSLPGDVRDRLGPFIEDLRQHHEVLFLPRVHEDWRVQWYVLCSSTRVARIARDELRAFLGPTYSDFEGRPTQLDSTDPIDAAVIARCGSNALKFDVPQRELIDAARERLLLLIHLRRERPTRQAYVPRAAGRILRDFEYALLAQDGARAFACIAELRTAGQLSATNLLFLEVRRLAATENWSSILALAELDALLGMRRPRRVTEALIRAVYISVLRRFEDEKRAMEAVQFFRSDVFPRFRDLYRTSAGLSGYEVDASFLVASAASSDPHPGLAQSILAKYERDSDKRSYLASVAELIRDSVPPQPDVIAEARAAFAATDIDRAYQLALGLPRSFERCALLLRCARDMGTLAATQIALESVDGLAEPDRVRLEAHAVLKRIRQELSDLAMKGATRSHAAVQFTPSSWADWLKCLSAVEPWRAAVSVAETAAREWSIDAFLNDAAVIQETADLLLSDRAPWGQVALRDALPYVLEFFLSGRREDPRLKPIFENLFLVIALDDQISLPQVTGLLTIADARLQLGIASEEYVEIVRQLSSAIDAVESPSVAGVALDAIEVLVSNACPNPSERQDFLTRVSVLFQRWYRRIDLDQWMLLRRFGQELNVPDAIRWRPMEDSSIVAASPWQYLQGKRIAMYSLRESALRRAQAIVQELSPKTRVETFHDRVGGSPALRAAAATADIFVIATAAAKHAATMFIEAHRPKTDVTLYARGQGSESFLSAIREYVLSL